MKKRTCKFLSATLALVLTISSMAMSVGAEELPVEVVEEVVVEEPAEEVATEETVEAPVVETEEAVVETVEPAEEEATEVTEDAVTEEIDETVVEATEEVTEITPAEADAEAVLEDAEEVEEDGAVMCTLDIANNSLTIDNAGAVESAFWESDPRYSTYDWDNLQKVVFGDAVTSICDNAFANYASLEDVTLGNDIVTIGAGAFTGCDIEEIVITKNVATIGAGAFENCTDLDTLTFDVAEGDDEAAVSIGERAFRNTGIANLVITKRVTSIGKRAFEACTSLDSVTISSSGDSKFGLRTIGDSAFKDCTTLDTVTIEKNNCKLSTISGSAFSGCADLDSIVIPKSVTTIGDDAFAGCEALNTAGPLEEDTYNVNYEDGEVKNCAWFKHFPDLSSIVIPNTISNYEIEKDAFKGNSNLVNVEIKSGVKTIGESAFENCSALENVTLPTSKTVKTIKAKAFKNCATLGAAANDEPGIQIDDVTSIGEEAFFGCTDLNIIRINDAVTNIPKGCFSGCTGLQSTVAAPMISKTSNLANIGEDAFKQCTSLQYMYLPKTMTVGNSAFFVNATDVSNLTRVDIKEGAYITLGEKVFYNCNNLEDLNILGGLVSVGTNAFFNCDSLVSLGYTDAYAIKYNFPSEVPDGLFRNITGLVTVDVPKGVTKIGANAFAECPNLTNVRLSDSVTTIGTKAFFDNDSLVRISRFTDEGTAVDTMGPQGIVNIGESAFESCGSLSAFLLPETLRVIGKAAFKGDTDLLCPNTGTLADTFTLPKGTTTIGDYAFEGCTGISNWGTGATALPNTITSVGNGAFRNCTGLAATIDTGVYFSQNVKTLGSKIFEGCDDTNNRLTIWGFSETSAEDYAEQYNIRFRTTQLRYNIIFDANGGTGSTVNMYDRATNTTYELSENKFTRSGYTFKGWNTKADGTGKSYADKASVMNLAYEATDVKLYAQWTSGSVTPSTTPTKTPTTIPGKNGWVKVGDKYYYYKDGNLVKNAWLKSDNKYYRLGSDGSPLKGWQKVGNYWFHFTASGGVMQTGWQKLGGQWYHFATNGVMQTGWQKLGGKWYHFSSKGVRDSSWTKIGDKWYYFTSKGYMATGWIKLSSTNKWYYLGTNGVMQTGWAKVNGKWYYMNSKGEMQTGWLTLSGKKYYLKSSGEMAIGWTKIGSQWYMFDSTGAMVKGVYNESGKTYYFRDNGSMAIGWVKVGNYYYYFYSNGVMAKNTTIDGKYKVDGYGRLTTS